MHSVFGANVYIQVALDWSSVQKRVEDKVDNNQS